jgi:hypothetical protein
MELHRKSGSERGILPEDFSVMWNGAQRNDATKNGAQIKEETSGGEVKSGAGGDSQGQEISGAAWYRMMLYADGEEIFVSMPKEGVVGGECVRVKKGFKREDAKTVLKSGGKLSFGQILQSRFRYLTDGLVFGRRRFVDTVFRKSRHYFGKKRKSGARPVREIEWQQPRADRLYSMRELKKNVL